VIIIYSIVICCCCCCCCRCCWCCWCFVDVLVVCLLIIITLHRDLYTVKYYVLEQLQDEFETHGKKRYGVNHRYNYYYYFVDVSRARWRAGTVERFDVLMWHYMWQFGEYSYLPPPPDVSTAKIIQLDVSVASAFLVSVIEKWYLLNRR